jgi:hypothetical protein
MWRREVEAKNGNIQTFFNPYWIMFKAGFGECKRGLGLGQAGV